MMSGTTFKLYLLNNGIVLFLGEVTGEFRFLGDLSARLIEEAIFENQGLVTFELGSA